MATKTNKTINGKDYYRIKRKVGKKLNKQGLWVDDYKYFYGKSKKEALEKYEAFLQKREAGVMRSGQTFGIMADMFISDIFLPSSKYTDRTKELYVSSWNKYVKPSSIAGRPLDQVTSMELQAFYNNVACTPGVLKSINNFMKIFYKYVSREGFCTDITTNVTLPAHNGVIKASNDVVIWEDEEIKTILANSKEHPYRFLIVLALNTGLRISELLALQYDDIEGNILHVKRQLTTKLTYQDGKVVSRDLVLVPPKYKSFRDVPLNDFVISELQEHEKRHKAQMLQKAYRTNFIFTTKNGRFIDRHNVNRSLKRLYNKLGLPNKSIHTYRHTFGTKLCANGTPIQTASALLGHSSISVTAKYYVNISSEEKIKAVNQLYQEYI